jgi:transposase
LRPTTFTLRFASCSASSGAGHRRAPNRDAITIALRRILRRTQERRNKALRSWHDSILARWDEIVAIAEHRPPTGRIEALNNNSEALVRRARGYRNHDATWE